MQVAVIGTLYKEMKLKPSVLDEYAKDRGLRAALAAETFCRWDHGPCQRADRACMHASLACALCAQQMGRLSFPCALHLIPHHTACCQCWPLSAAPLDQMSRVKAFASVCKPLASRSVRDANPAQGPCVHAWLPRGPSG